MATIKVDSATYAALAAAINPTCLCGKRVLRTEFRFELDEANIYRSIAFFICEDGHALRA